MGIDVLSKATGRRLVHWTPANVRDCVLWQGPPRPTYNTQPTLVDGDMEAAGTTAWTSGNSATLSKQTSDPHSGTRCLRVSGDVYPYAYQSNILPGNAYRAVGWARVLSGAPASVRIGSGNNSWQTSSTSWTSFDVTATATDPSYGLMSVGTVAGQSSEFDDTSITNLSLTSLSPAVGAPLTQSTATAMPWIDTTTGLVKYQTDVLSWSGAVSLSKCLHDGTGGTLIVCVRPSVLNAVNIFASTCALNALNHGMLMWYANDNTAVIYVFNGSGTPDLVTTFACPVAVNNTYVFTVRIRSGVGGVTFRSNSVNKYTGALTAPSTSNPSAGFKIGDLTYPIDGLIPDCAVYNRVLTDSECLRIERYMYRQAEGVDPSW